MSNPKEPNETNSIFVTGATSPVGLRVVRRLSEEGYSLCCLLRTARHERELFNYGLTAVVRGDCRNPEAWEHALEGSPLLLHLAPVSLSEPLVQAAKNHGVKRFVALSSTRGFSRVQDPVAEGVRKGEAAIEASGLEYTILRSSMMYGSRQDANIQRLAEWLDRHAWMPLIGGGRARVQPIHVDDVVEAIARTVAMPNDCHRARMTIAGPQSLSWREMVEAVARVHDRRIRWLNIPQGAALKTARFLAWLSPRHAYLPGAIQRLTEDRAYDIEETMDLLGGWTPMKFEEGLERTYRAPVNTQATLAPPSAISPE